MFLLIPEVNDIAAVVPSFTFQYVSINTVASMKFSAIRKRFTFQYVSINTRYGTDVNAKTTLYIPICFY